MMITSQGGPAIVSTSRLKLTVCRWFALVRLWSPWLAPRHGKETFKLDRQGVLCSFLSDSGQHMVLLAISGVDNVMTLFESDEEGNVMLKVSCAGFMMMRS